MTRIRGGVAAGVLPVVLLLLTLLPWSGSAFAADAEMEIHRDLRYAEIEGVDPGLTSLDVYAPKGAKKAPVLVMIHGGAWSFGDKTNRRVAEGKSSYFTSKGWVFVSINYRLSPAVRHPAHVQDVARALVWLREKLPAYGGDPERVFLMGHSAGAHLAALVATDGRHLDEAGGALRDLDGVVLLDGAGYNMPREVNDLGGRAMRRLYEVAFGPDQAIWKDASPLTHVAPDKHIPPFLVFDAGRRRAGETISQEFAQALVKAGTPAKVIYATDRDHGGMNRCIGEPDDPYTALVMKFLESPATVGALEHVVKPEAQAASRAARIFRRLDADGDGRLTRVEFHEWRVARRRPELFDRIDADRDGVITAEEATAFREGRPLAGDPPPGR